MTVSIVIPAYNAEAYLPETLESVLAQTLTDWELIVVDDGSHDSTAGIVERFMRRDDRIRLLRQANGGIASARNSGWASSDPGAELLAFLDADDVWEPDALETLAAALSGAPAASAAYGLARFIDASGAPICAGELEEWCRVRERVEGDTYISCGPHEPTTFAVLAVRNCVATSGVALIRRVSLNQAGPYDPVPRGCEDYNMWLRLSRLGPLLPVDRTVLSYRRHSAGLSRRGRLMDRGDLLARQEVARDLDLTDEERSALRRGYARFQRETSAMRLRMAGRAAVRAHMLGAAVEARRAARDYLRSVRGLPV